MVGVLETGAGSRGGVVADLNAASAARRGSPAPRRRGWSVICVLSEPQAHLRWRCPVIGAPGGHPSRGQGQQVQCFDERVVPQERLELPTPSLRKSGAISGEVPATVTLSHADRRAL